jgi:hypothetical protein
MHENLTLSSPQPSQPIPTQQHHQVSPPSAAVTSSRGASSSNIKSPLPYTTSNVDDFMQTTKSPPSLREREISSSSDDNLDDYEPYSRRDFRMDLKSSDKVMMSNETPTSGYFTSPNETKEAMSTFSPESSDYEKFDHQKQIIKKRDEYSSSPVDSQRSTSSLCRKSVSFDLDVEEYTPPYNPNYDEVESEDAQRHYDENVFYEKSRFHHQQPQQPKRIKGILRAQSPSVYYHTTSSSSTAATQNRMVMENEDDEEIEKENPFRKEYLSQEKLNAYDDEQQQSLSAIHSVISDSDQFDIRNQFVQSGSTENLNKTSKIPIKKTIFKATGNIVEVPTNTERPKVPPPPRPPKPQVKVAEMVKNEGLEKMSQQMEENDFMEFVHDAKTNTIQEVASHSRESFNPDISPLPPIPKNPPPPLNLKRLNSKERPKDSPPPPPTPIARTPTSEILEILPAKFDSLPRKQVANFVNENSQNNMLVTEDQHREMLLQENDLRNAILSEYDEQSSTDNNNSDKLIANFSSTNPFLDETSSSITSFSYGSSPNLLSPVSTLDKSSSSLGYYTPVYKDIQHVSPVNILPPQPQVLPVHYGQLPKPQQASFPIHSHQLPIHYSPNPTGISVSNIQQQTPQQYVYHQQQFVTHPHEITSVERQQSRTYLVSGDGQNMNSFYVTHNVNNNTPPNNQPHHQTLLMQSAYGPFNSQQQQHQQQLQLPSMQQQMHLQSLSQSVVSTPQNSNQPQFIFEQQQQQQHHLHQIDSSISAHQFVHEHSYVDSISELSPIRVNQTPQNNFMFASENESRKSTSMSSFGKQTEV